MAKADFLKLAKGRKIKYSKYAAESLSIHVCSSEFVPLSKNAYGARDQVAGLCNDPVTLKLI